MYSFSILNRIKFINSKFYKCTYLIRNTSHYFYQTPTYCNSPKKKKLDSKYPLSTSLILEAIKDSMIVNIANNCIDPNIGLNLSKDYATQKIYMADTGLLVAAIFEDSKLPIEESIYKQLIVDKLGVNMSMVLENAISQALVCSGHSLYFHQFDNYEIDFLLTFSKKLIPIEVKSSSYSSHKSLNKFNDKYSDRVKTSYVIYSKDLKREGNVTYIPFYMSMFL